LDPAFDDWIGRERERRLRLREASSPHRPVRLGIRPLRLLGVWDEGGFAAGLEEELIAALTKFRWLSCVPVSGSEGEEGACLEYLLCGSVRRSGAHLRIGLRLLDARGGGEVVWTRSFDGMSEDALSLQGRIAAEAAAQIDPELLTREGGRAAARLNDRPSGMELALAALPGMFRLERDQFERSGQLLSEAAARAPDLASVHAWLAYWNIVAVGQGWRTDRQAKEAMQRAGALAERAVVLDPLDARAITIAGHVRAFLDRHVEEGLALHERALALNPALPMAWMWSGLAHAYRGDHHRAIEDIERARSLSPFDPHAFFFEVALMLPHLMLGDYRRAAELGRVTAQVKPGFSSSWKALLAAVGHLGRPAEAAEIRTRLLQLEPGFCVSQAMQRSPFVRPEDRARFAEGLRLGGLPA
jgi:TolB-like protein